MGFLTILKGAAKFLGAGLVLVACTFEPRPPKVTKINKKFCVAVCRAYEFNNFHSSPRTWGASASSMQGLYQSQIYDRVSRECENFYKDEDCCSSPYESYKYLNTIHSRDFGACK